MKTNRLPLGLVVFNSEINPPKGGSSPGSSPPVLLGGWCAQLQGMTTLSSSHRRHEAWLWAPEWMEEFATIPAPPLVNHKLAQLKSAERVYSKFMFLVSRWWLQHVRSRWHQSPGPELGDGSADPRGRAASRAVSQ